MRRLAQREAALLAHSQPGAELHLASREEPSLFRDFSGIFHKRSLFRELLLHGQSRV